MCGSLRNVVCFLHLFPALLGDSFQQVGESQVASSHYAKGTALQKAIDGPMETPVQTTPGQTPCRGASSQESMSE